MKRDFASDNCAGVHSDVLQAIENANQGHAKSYGDDPDTERAVAAFRRHFGDATEVFFVFNGTAANVLGLSSLLKSHQAIICANSAHIAVDECGAPEKWIGSKIIPIPTHDGKLRPEEIRPLLQFGDPHKVQPKVISISQTTEFGTVYTADEVRALAKLAHDRGMYLHMDGARISNAAASLGSSLASFTCDAGVDVLSFGGTKNGLLFGEAVVFFNHSPAAKEFKFIRKQGMQLASKMRFVAAQFDALLSSELWLKNARHANEMAGALQEKVRKIAGVEILFPVQANGVFARIPREAIAPLQKKFFFHVWDEAQGSVRWMTSFDTTAEDVDAFARAIQDQLKPRA